MNPLVWVSLSAVATGLAFVIARRRLPYHPIAWFLSLGLVADLTRQIIQQYVLFPEYAKREAEFQVRREAQASASKLSHR